MITALLMASGLFSTMHIVEQVDHITDAHSVYAVMGTDEANLAIGCERKGDPDTARVVIHFDRYIGDATPGLILGGRDLVFRFDQRQAQAVRWSSHEHDVFAEQETARPVKFMVAMKGSTLLNLRVADAVGDPHDMAFRYQEPTPVIEAVLKQCGFTPDGHVAKR